MRFIAFGAAVLVTTTTALPQFTTPIPISFLGVGDPHEWQAPIEGDVRAPCPGINTLANHGFINRNGRNITVDDFNRGFLEAFGMAYDVTTPGAVNTMNLCTSKLPAGSSPCTSADLDILDTPHALEHDGSMRSQDKGMYGGTGNNQAYNSTIMEATKNIWGDATHISFQLAETVRQRRNEEQKAVDDPGWFIENDGGALTEQAFTLSAMNDTNPFTEGSATQGNARIDWVAYWYENERLPTDLGWVKPTTTIYQAQIASITDALQAATTIPAATTTSISSTITAGLSAGSTIAPGIVTISFNPYQDIQGPEVWQR